MDVYLSREAYQFLISLNLFSSKPKMDGLLLGHKRGSRFFVEKILPAEKGFYSFFENYLAADKYFKGKLLGFFTFESDEKKIKKNLLPFNFGQLFLDIHSNKKKKMTIKSYIIDYENDFYLSPIDLRLPKSGDQNEQFSK